MILEMGFWKDYKSPYFSILNTLGAYKDEYSMYNVYTGVTIHILLYCDLNTQMTIVLQQWLPF